MSGLAAYEWALLAAVALVSFEVMTGTFVALSLAVGCLAVAGAEFMAGAAALVRDGLLFVACAGLATFVLRRLFARPGDSRPARGDVNEF